MVAVLAIGACVFFVYNETFSLTSNNELAKEQQQSIRPPKSCCMLEIQQFDATKTLYMNCFDWKKTLKTLLEIG